MAENRPTALITGAAAGVGRALADLLASEGWRLVLHTRNPERSAALRQHFAARTGTLFVEADLADRAAVAAMAEAVREQCPRLDALFNNAGVMLGEDRRSPCGVEMHAEINWLAPYQLVRLLAPSLETAGGTVVNVSSRAARFGGCPEPDALLRPKRPRTGLFGAYATSKLALSATTAALAPEYAARGVTLLSIHPGVLSTGMTNGGGMPGWLRLLGPLTYDTPEKGARQLRTALDPKWRASAGGFIVGDRLSRLPACVRTPAARSAYVAACRKETGL